MSTIAIYLMKINTKAMDAADNSNSFTFLVTFHYRIKSGYKLIIKFYQGFVSNIIEVLHGVAYGLNWGKMRELNHNNLKYALKYGVITCENFSVQFMSVKDSETICAY